MRVALALTSLLFCLAANAQWQMQQSHTTADLRGIHSLPNGVAWASGTDGTVLRTEDSGQTWQTCAVPPEAEHLDFRGVQAFDAQTAIVMSSGKGDLSRLYKTTDACKTWKLVFTNPDQEGFWDAMAFDLNFAPGYVKAYAGRFNGVLIGDPVDGKFVIYRTFNSGDNWTSWPNDRGERAASSDKEEALFAASNSSVVTPGSNGPLAFVTGGKNGSRLFLAQPRSPFDASFWYAFTTLKLPMGGSVSSGAFAVTSRFPVGSPFADLMIVGGDYSKPDAREKTAVFAPAPIFPFSKRIFTPKTPPHGYRSSVAYLAAQNAWITVGPNGTDVSIDDGRNWHALRPSPIDAPDADRKWNALSLPFVVGPHGRIGLLRPEALRP